ncbi:MAG: hypothetical protein U9N60_00500 [Thermodesulfobacteriota bacterium]|nr:hypothetical protein [Thermodesulfobacteriota bacterium]
MFGSASQGGEQADQLYFGMLGSLIAFLWSAAEYLRSKGINSFLSANMPGASCSYANCFGAYFALLQTSGWLI